MHKYTNIFLFTFAAVIESVGNGEIERKDSIGVSSARADDNARTRREIPQNAATRVHLLSHHQRSDGARVVEHLPVEPQPERIDYGNGNTRVGCEVCWQNASTVTQKASRVRTKTASGKSRENCPVSE